MSYFFLWFMRVLVMVMLVEWGHQSVMASKTGSDETAIIAFSLFAFLFALYGFAAWFKKRGRI
ncbi:hypothetical protein KAH37_08565 [bacterium]|nr:hypothetical protein [bacterium]